MLAHGPLMFGLVHVSYIVYLKLNNCLHLLSTHYTDWI